MKFNASEEEISDYLFGNLSEKDKASFELEMSKNEALKKEVASLQQLVGVMEETPEKEILIPELDIQKEKQRAPINLPPARTNKSQFWAWSVAAAMLLLFTLGYVLQLRVGVQNSSLVFSYGTPVVQSEYIEKVDLDNAIAKALDKQEKLHERQMEEMKDEIRQIKLDQKEEIGMLTSAIENKAQPKMEIPKEVLVGFMEQLESKNKVSLQEMMTLSEAKQKQFTMDLVADFSDYLETKRKQDLAIIDQHLQTLQINSELKQLETEQVLASLLSLDKINNNNNALQND